MIEETKRCDQCGDRIREGHFVWYEKSTYCSEECRDKEDTLTELKPCPFCAGQPYQQVWTEAENSLSKDISRIACNCGAYGAEMYGDDCLEKAIAAWNVRKEAP